MVTVTILHSSTNSWMNVKSLCCPGIFTVVTDSRQGGMKTNALVPRLSLMRIPGFVSADKVYIETLL